MKTRAQAKSGRSQPPSLSDRVAGPITFTLGKQHFSPIQYNHFEVGPFEVSLQPRLDSTSNVDRDVFTLNETYGQMLERATELLEDMFDQEFERTLNKFLDRMERMGKIVKERSKR